jgi:hypothetical protein
MRAGSATFRRYFGGLAIASEFGTRLTTGPGRFIYGRGNWHNKWRNDWGNDTNLWPGRRK